MKYLEPRSLLSLIEDAIKVLSIESTLLEIESPAYIIGDLHGNYEDLMKFARFFGMWYLEVVPAKFLFLGDYVDRGPHSIETISFLLALKVLFPEKVFLLRGNHESNDINADFKTYRDVSLLYQCCSIYDEKIDTRAMAAVAAASSAPGKAPFPKDLLDIIAASPGLTVWYKLNECFNYLPLAATVDGKVFCVHGGLPRCIATQKGTPTGPNILTDIKSLARPITNVYASYMLFDLLWADPATMEEEKFIESQIFGQNQRGGDTIIFGKKAISKFTQMTGCTHILRAHQSPKHGIDIGKDASALTVFSSSHYCSNTNSAGAVLAHHGALNIIVFGSGVSSLDSQAAPGPKVECHQQN
eukprot:TRINITY_DN1115_c0_g1_i2.p1 TRINITY_DN1115_c0_g1~~TRINITY_DN1115_c0_g1_i2.p1  ORF type:complete len:357 (-),score=110.25 TRINITY_DN1115_c0_g1_i2:155-1225(-)